MMITDTTGVEHVHGISLHIFMLKTFSLNVARHSAKITHHLRVVRTVQWSIPFSIGLDSLLPLPGLPLLALPLPVSPLFLLVRRIPQPVFHRTPSLLYSTIAFALASSKVGASFL